jgi:putative hemolysin
MDKYLFSYATESDPPIKRGLIRLVEKATGQPKLKRMYVHNQRFPRLGETFWQAAVRSLELDVRYDADALAAVPKSGPVVFVANHPYGVLDGIVMAWLVSKVRTDFVVLTHIVLTRAPEAAQFILPVDFSGAKEAERTNLASRAAARAQLERGGAVVVFPAGAISTAPDKLGLKPAVDGRWQPFVSQLVQRSKAPVVPIWFGGQNSRLFQIASHLSLTLRLSLIFHEVRTRIGPPCPWQSGRPSPSSRSPGSETGRRSPTTCARASMPWRSSLRRLTSRAPPSASRSSPGPSRPGKIGRRSGERRGLISESVSRDSNGLRRHFRVTELASFVRLAGPPPAAPLSGEPASTCEF